MNARVVAGWSATCLLVALLTANPGYRALVLVAALLAVAGAGWRRARPLLVGVGTAGLLTTALNFVLSHLGADVLFSLPAAWPAIGGAYTLEALVFGLVTGLTLAGALLAVAPLSLRVEPHELVDALPRSLSRTGAALAAGLNLVPVVARSFVEVAEAQRLRGWRPRGPRSWAEVALPVVLTAIESSIQTAESMEARAYGSGSRTTYAALRWTRADLAVLAACGLAALLFVVARALGQAVDWFPYPYLRAPELSPLGIVACLLLLVGPLAWRSRRSG
ncbi:MAG TPA: energy-coupling factor transporter transmembrane component T [Candidatus Dormibacteraeota bacterium]